METIAATRPRQDAGRAQARQAAASGEVGAESSYVPGLDGVRALAIGTVFALHLDRSRFPGGAAGVDVFFALSAFLITGNLLREHAASGRVRLRDFYWRRAFRLVPALVVWVFLVATTTALVTGNTGRLSWNLGGSLFYFNDFLQALTHWVKAPFDQSWSLSVEEQFYLIWPFVLLFGLLRLRRPAQRGILLALMAAGALLLFRGGDYFLPTGHLLPLALGCWAGWSTSVGLPRRLLPILRLPWFGVACGALVIAACLVGEHGAAENAVVAIVVALAAVGLILNVTEHRSSVAARVLGSPVPRWIGARSYGMYLYGLTMLQLIPALTHLPLRYAAPLAVVATVAVVEFSYVWIESPVRVRGRRWLKSRRRPQLEPALEVSPVA